ncbi:MAG: hypothetical protein V3S24_06925 [Candidatus Tectomicrobia bacterium]
MPKSWFISSVLAVLLSGAISVPTVSACGGVKAFIVDEVPTEGVRAAKGPRNVTFYYDAEGNALLPTSAAKVDSALAEAIARRYLAQFHGDDAGHLEFEGLVYEHGDFVYMYHADVQDLAYSVHVGPVSFVSEHAHIHVSATTGAVHGPGCGFGSGTVVMPFEPAAYTAELSGKRLPYVQFDSHFRIQDGPAPRIDGKIEAPEWADAGHAVLTVGTRHTQVQEYG